MAAMEHTTCGVLVTSMVGPMPERLLWQHDPDPDPDPPSQVMPLVSLRLRLEHPSASVTDD